MDDSPAHQLVARAGEEIVCPECGFVEGVFTGDAYGPHGKNWPVVFAVIKPFPRDGGCAECGATWLKALSEFSMTIAECAGAHCIMMHIRSGAWIGWRALGAE